MVAQQRSGWRDEGLSLRHRSWGWDCPALDIDFLMCEYDRGKPSALVEYKNEHAAPQYASHPSYKALVSLGDAAGLPVFACRYADDFQWFKAVALNQIAKQFLPQGRQQFNEPEWVSFLYKLRGRQVDQKTLAAIAERPF